MSMQQAYSAAHTGRQLSPPHTASCCCLVMTFADSSLLLAMALPQAVHTCSWWVLASSCLHAAPTSHLLLAHPAHMLRSWCSFTRMPSSASSSRLDKAWLAQSSLHGMLGRPAAHAGMRGQCAAASAGISERVGVGPMSINPTPRPCLVQRQVLA